MTDPSHNGDSGRRADGRFAVGNKAGKGNPHAWKVHKLRSMLLKSVTEADIRAAAKKLVELARGGDLAAIRELLDRTTGKAPPTLEILDREEESEVTNESIRRQIDRMIAKTEEPLLARIAELEAAGGNHTTNGEGNGFTT
jgi:hypothetical protein